MKKILLGIDLGTNSIGWAAYTLDDNGNPRALPRLGVRIFPDGRDEKAGASLNEDRRKARLMRRQIDRRLRRRKGLMDALVKAELMPQSVAGRKALEKLDPWQLRALAAIGGDALTDFAHKHNKKNPNHPVTENHLVGRALFHLNQRRGFQSNRKIAGGKEDGPVNESIAQFRSQLNDETAGQYLWQVRRRGESVRARRTGTTPKDLYPFYADRRMIADEFNKIWKAQAARAPAFFTEEKRRIFCDDTDPKKLGGVIFHQRPLKPPIIGKCRYFPEEERAPLALPSYQRFRILSEVNNLRYWNLDGEALEIPAAARAEIVTKLISGSPQVYKFEQMLKVVKQHDDRACEMKKWGEKRQGLDADKAAMIFGKIAGLNWRQLSPEKQDEFVALLCGDESDADVRAALGGEWKLSDADADACIDAALKLPDRHGSLSAKAVKLLIPHLENGLRYDEAVSKAGLGAHSDSGKRGETRSDLLPYPEELREYCLPRNKEDEAEPDKWRIPNPTVHVALNQLRTLVNDFIRIYGKPAKFVLELARDLPQSAKAKAETEKRQKENQQARERRRGEIEKLGLPANGENIRKYQLWEETARSPHDRGCVFCGQSICAEHPKIGPSSLFSPQVHIEHILPQSRTLDDSMANKTIACQSCNNDKGNRTPFEAFGEDEARYAEICARAKNLPGNKNWRFQPDAMERFEREDGFLARQLTDTQYIAKAARRYLESIAKREDILVIPGRLTALLRHAWGLNSVLDEIRGDDSGDAKNRDDHRHHAIDAAVVGATSRSLLQKIATEAGKMEQAGLSDLAKATPEPMADFRAAVKSAAEKIIISHKPNRKREGKLHKETAYGIVGEADKTGKREVVHRVPLFGAEEQQLLQRKDIPKIRDPKLRKNFADIVKLETDGGLSFPQAREKFARDNQIRRVRVVERRSVILMPAKNPFKAYWGRSNWAYEIFAVSDGNGGEKWGWEIISTFEANKHRRKTNAQGEEEKIPTHIPRWRKKLGAKLVMRIHGGDMIALGEKGASRPRLFRVQKISDGDINLAEHFEANAAARHSEKNDEFEFVRIRSAEGLRKRGGRKIHISPAGLVNDPGPPAPPTKKK